MGRTSAQWKFKQTKQAFHVVQDGYEFFGNRHLVTIFSAPHYCGQFDNAAASMIVDENLVCSFQVLFYLFRSETISLTHSTWRAAIQFSKFEVADR
ncbi:unnamed protein product [Gongylonema pulchrum]|uniref:protein-serine/threonine phosphatase n=1 Tax=Gongylonema pulchrum TaxID=637853 RepID=A0A183F0D4_9BILA|nr:unnamed protein product [Gongylonema pulchrum]